jgi:hypothetical protein
MKVPVLTGSPEVQEHGSCPEVALKRTHYCTQEPPCLTWIRLGVLAFSPPFTHLVKHLHYMRMANHALVRFDIQIHLAI